MNNVALTILIVILVVIVGGYALAKIGIIDSESLQEILPDEDSTVTPISDDDMKQENSPPPNSSSPARGQPLSVTGVLASAEQLVNTSIAIEDVVSFDHLCTDEEGGDSSDCVTKVYLGSLLERNIQVKISGEEISCSGLVSTCEGWQKDSQAIVEGVLHLRQGSENFLATYYIDVTSHETVE